MFNSVFFVLTVVKLTHSFSDVGKWELPLSGDSCEFTLAKSLFQGSKVMVKCFGMYTIKKQNRGNFISWLFVSLSSLIGNITKYFVIIVNDKEGFDLSIATITLHCHSKEEVTVSYEWRAKLCSPDYFHYFEKRIVDCSTKRRVQRSANDTVSYTYSDQKTYPCDYKNTFILNYEENQSNPAKAPAKEPLLNVKPLFEVDKEGIYMFKMSVKSQVPFNATAEVVMVGPGGTYLSAAIWPLLPFFGVMCGVYTVLCAGWLLVCGLQWRDLLRIQYWIGGVALLGMVESATYYAVYSSINSTGLFNAEAYMFAEWVSVAKRALARMLVIIVSLGFGIVKPRLGPALQRVVGTGLLWGLLAAIDAWLRLHHKADDSNRDLLLSEAPLSLLDSAICWWVFVSLSHTMRTLQLRRNTIKMSLYRHFTNTLIFAVVSSVIFMLYSIKSYRVTPCITSWQEVWMDEAYWHILFASVLTVIMVLWRPTNNNQRYAFTPLLDNAEDDDEEEEQFVNDAYGVKMRGASISGQGDGKDHDYRDNSEANTLDSDLRWVEENIPTSTLPLLDSDEEIINTKFEVSKMQ